MTTIKLLLVDDVLQVRQGLRTLLPLLAQGSDLELAIVGEAANGREAVEQVKTLEPDVVLMDLAMPEMDGCTAARAIKRERPHVAVVAFSVHGSPEARRQAAEAGVDAFIVKGAPMQALLAAIRSSNPNRSSPLAGDAAQS